MKKSVLNKRISMLISLICAVFVFGHFLTLDNQPTTLDLSLHSTHNTDKPIEPEKTVSKESISALFHATELTAEQAVIFHASLPQSLADSPLPSSLDVNENGQLIINMKVKRLFEFYLSAMGEDTLAECIERIRHNLNQQLEADALTSALQLLEGFLQYQNHIGHIKNDFLARYDDQTYNLERVQEMKQSVRESRSLFFSEEASLAFYQQEDEYDNYMIKKVAIRSDQNLTDEEKQSQYDLLTSESPSWISQQEHQASLINKVKAQEKTLRENGADQSSIYELRVENYGVQAAQNLAALDHQRAQWASRVSQYRLENEQILSNSSYTQAEKNQLSQDIRQQHFSGSELIRINALDKIAADNAQ
ncbi:MAG: lipase chaperone LimK [Oceanicoccus sp.]|jgi:lipase chaperone LimK